MQLLNEMTPEAGASRERQKPFCSRCKRWVRERTTQTVFTVIWNGEQVLPPRWFVNARMRVTEENWTCPACPAAREGKPVAGMWIDVEHVGHPSEIILID